MTDPAREPLLFIRIEADIKTAGELNRQGKLEDAIAFVVTVESMAKELSELMAFRADAPGRSD